MAEITARAIVPVAVEMLDGVMLRMVEEATHAGYPMDAAAVLLIELEGLRETVEEQVAQIQDACRSCHAREVRVAQTAEERELLWKGRKNAFGAVGRVSPTYYVQDGVVPRTQIAPTLRAIAEVSGSMASPSVTFFMPATATCIPSFCLIRASPEIWRKPAPPAPKSWTSASAWAGRSPANMAWEWRRMS